MLTMYQQITIKTLKKQGRLIKDIASELNCHRNTVTNILSRSELINKQKRERPSYFDRFYDLIGKYLKEEISRLRIWEILTAEYTMNRTYDSLCKYIQVNFPKYKQAYVVQVTDPGETAEVDFGYLGLVKDSITGAMKKAYVFIMTLCYSRQAYYGVTYDQSVKSFINAHINAFNYFGGIPKRIKIDNLKSAVLKNRRYDLEFNKDFLEFSHHYNFVIAPCTPYQPQQKGKVESGVGYVKKNFKAGRRFPNDRDLEIKLNHWMRSYANQRIHGTIKVIPKDKFINEEKQKLQSLPETEFAFYESCSRQVSINCHINFINNYYSVPYQYIDKSVEVRTGKNLVRIYVDNDEIALHPMYGGQGQYITNPLHYPPDKCYSSTTYQQKYENKMKTIGPYSSQFFQLVIKKDPSYWGRTIRRTLGLANKVGNERIEMAIKRTLYFNAISFNTLKNIIDQGLENMELDKPIRTIETTENEAFIIEGNIIEGNVEENIGENNSIDRDLNYYQLQVK